MMILFLLLIDSDVFVIRFQLWKLKETQETPRNPRKTGKHDSCCYPAKDSPKKKKTLKTL